ncbi:MAG: PilZ domain-containing protein [Pseudomonadota bacterium]
MEKKLRTDEREAVALVVALPDGNTGVTRDVSASGLYFTMDGEFRRGNIIDFSITLSINDRPLLLVGQGEVVRVEEQGQHSGIAIKMLHSQMKDVSAAGPHADI